MDVVSVDEEAGVTLRRRGAGVLQLAVAVLAGAAVGTTLRCEHVPRPRRPTRRRLDVGLVPSLSSRHLATHPGYQPHAAQRVQ